MKPTIEKFIRYLAIEEVLQKRADGYTEHTRKKLNEAAQKLADDIARLED